VPKFYGKVGYSGGSVEEPAGSGIWVDGIVERSYYGDIKRLSRNLEQGEAVNNDISVSHSISLVADAYAFENFMHIQYVEWLGGLWTVTNVEVQPPRLILSLGELYNRQSEGP